MYPYTYHKTTSCGNNNKKINNKKVLCSRIRTVFSTVRPHWISPQCWWLHCCPAYVTSDADEWTMRHISLFFSFRYPKGHLSCLYGKVTMFWGTQGRYFCPARQYSSAKVLYNPQNCFLIGRINIWRASIKLCNLLTCLNSVRVFWSPRACAKYITTKTFPRGYWCVINSSGRWGARSISYET